MRGNGGGDGRGGENRQGGAAPEGALAEPVEGVLQRLSLEPQAQATMLDAIFAASPCRIFVTDREGRLIYVSLLGGQAVGLERTELLGKTWREVGSPGRDMKQLDELRERALAGQPSTGEVPFHTPEGLRDYQYVIKPVRLPDGSIVGVNTCLQDVTERTQIEKERERLLAEVENRAAELDAVIASAAVGLIIYDAAGDIVHINPAAETILGYSEETEERPIAERLERLRPTTPEGRPIPIAQAPPMRALRGETVRNVVSVLHLPDREVWISGSAAPIRTPHGAFLGVVLSFVDITAEHELQEQREDILRAVSHDLRNPLATIQAQAGLLLRMQRQAGVDGQQQRSAEAILAGSRRMNTMIQDLVDAARSESGQLRLDRRPIDMRSSMLDLKQRLAPTMDVDRIEVDVPDGLPPVWADPDRLERILVNLWSNALRYSAPGTPVSVSAAERDGEVVVSVSDRGPGIPPEQLPLLFERYYRPGRTRRGREGVGLGLYITRMLVEAHGGRIWAESNPGVGSTFSFSLPVAG